MIKKLKMSDSDDIDFEYTNCLESSYDCSGGCDEFQDENHPNLVPWKFTFYYNTWLYIYPTK